MGMKQKKKKSKKSKKNFKMADLKKMSFSKSPILKKILVHGLVELIDAKSIDVAQPIWLRDSLT